MDKNQMKMTGVVCLLVSAICIFVAVERYNTNAGNVKAMNAFSQSSPFRGMMGVGKMTPTTPAAAKYAIFFALISGIGGATLVLKSGTREV